MRIDDLDPLTLERAQAGDVRCQHEAIEACSKLIHWMSYLWIKRSPSLDIRDLEQQGVLGVYDAIRTYDAAKGAFPRHAFLWISHRVRTWVMKDAVYRERHPVGLDGPSGGNGLERELEPHDGRYSSRVNKAILEASTDHGYATDDLVDYSRVFDAIATLDSLHRAAFEEMVMNGVSSIDFGASFGHTQQWATKVRRAAMSMVRRFMEGAPS